MTLATWAGGCRFADPRLTECSSSSRACTIAGFNSVMDDHLEPEDSAFAADSAAPPLSPRLKVWRLQKTGREVTCEPGTTPRSVAAGTPCGSKKWVITFLENSWR